MINIKKLLFLIFIIFFTTNVVQATEKEDILSSQEDLVGITDFIKESQKYTEGDFSGLDLDNLLQESISGKVNKSGIYAGILKIFSKEIKNEIAIFASILLIIIVSSILNCITEGLQNKSVSQIAFYVSYILIVTIVLTNFSSVIESIKNTTTNMTNFINMLMPIMMTLIISTGHVTTASIIQPAIVYMATLMGNFINGVAIPLVLVSTALGIVSQISDKIQIGRLSKRIKASTIWIIGILLTAFVTFLSVDGSLSSSVDMTTAKTAKAAVSNLIPVVGKILGDAVDSVLGCSNILKNAVGVIGVIIIIIIAIAPIIKILMLMGIYYIGSAICEPIADTKVINLLDQMGDTFKVLFALVCSMSVMMIIGITLVLKISNAGAIA